MSEEREVVEDADFFSMLVEAISLREGSLTVSQIIDNVYEATFIGISHSCQRSNLSRNLLNSHY